MTTESAPDDVCPRPGNAAWLEPPASEIGLWCDVSVCGLENLHPFIKLIGVATNIIEMVTSDLLIYYYFVRSCENN